MRCKYCNNNKGHVKGYRDNNGVLSSEVTCSHCATLLNKSVRMIQYLNLEEGENYWTVDFKPWEEVQYVLRMSAWDDYSDLSTRGFTHMEDAIRYLISIGAEQVYVQDYRIESYTLKILS